MNDVKTKRHTTYTYETSDGREFDDKKEAMEWQKLINTIEDMKLLDSEFEPTVEIDRAIYVYAKTSEQADAFNVMQTDMGMSCDLPSAGFFRYDDIANKYVEVESEIEKLQHIIDMLKGGGE